MFADDHLNNERYENHGHEVTTAQPNTERPQTQRHKRSILQTLYKNYRDFNSHDQIHQHKNTRPEDNIDALYVAMGSLDTDQTSTKYSNSHDLYLNNREPYAEEYIRDLNNNPVSTQKQQRSKTQTVLSISEATSYENGPDHSGIDDRVHTKNHQRSKRQAIHATTEANTKPTVNPNGPDRFITPMPLSAPYPIMDYLELACVFFFTLEFIARFIFSPCKKRFFLEALNIIDLLSILPFIIILTVDIVLVTEKYQISALDAVHILKVSAISYFLGKGGYVFGSVGLFVSNITKKNYKWIAMRFYGGVQGGIYKELIKFSWQSGSSEMSK